MAITDERIDNLNEMAKLLRNIADGMEDGRIVYVPGVTHLETQFADSTLHPEKGKLLNGYFRLNLTYYDREKDDTIKNVAINLEIHDSTMGSSDNHR